MINKYNVVVTSESAPRGHAFWTLDNESVIFETLLDAQSYVLFLQTQETEADKADAYYEKYGPLITIYERTKNNDDDESWAAIE